MNRCRSCQAAVVWAMTTNGKRMPMDAEPSEAGTFALTKDDPPRAIHTPGVVEPGTLREGRYTSHFATCPQASQHRRKP